MGSVTSRFVRDVKEEFKKNPLTLMWKLLIFPFAVVSLTVTACFIALLNLSVKDGSDFIKGCF